MGPNGIAFERHGDVWLTDEDGGDIHQLTHTRAGIYPAAWSSDIIRLLAAYPAMHNGKLYSVNVPTGAAKDLTGFVGDLYAQGLSRNGTTILAAIGCGGTQSPFGRVETIPFAGGRPTVIARCPSRELERLTREPSTAAASSRPAAGCTSSRRGGCRSR